MNGKLIYGAALLAMLAGCAQLQTPAPGIEASAARADSQQDDDDGDPSTPSKAAALQARNLPRQELTNEVLFGLLLGEVALQRGRGDVASGAYAELVKRTKDPRIARRGTEVAVVTGHLSQALADAQTWSEVEPESLAAKHALISLLVRQGSYEEALPQLRAVLAQQTVSLPRVWLELHDMLVKQQDKDGALAFARTLAADYASVAEAHFVVGALAWRAGDIELAQQEVKRALDIRPDWELAALFQAQILQKQSLDAARFYLADYLKRYPNARDVRLTYARLLVSNREWGAARNEFQRIVDKEPQNGELMLAIASLSLEMKEPQSAIGMLTRAEAVGLRDTSGLYLMLGQAYEDMNDAEHAKQAYLAVPAGERFAPAQGRYARLLAKDGRLDDALSHFEKLPAKTDEQRVMWLQMEVQLLRDAKLYERAYTLLNGALKTYPNNSDLLYDRAMIAERLDRIDQVEKDLRQVLKIKPDSAMALNALGYTLADRTNRHQEALKLIESARKIDPDDPFILDSLGWVKFRLGRLEEALDDLNKAYSSRPDPEIAAHIGEVLWSMGRRQEAQTTWQDALKQNPEHDQLLQVIKKFNP